jgi:hypothetical protein
MEERRSGVAPCTTGCGRLTRSSRTAPKDAPGTLKRVAGGKCQRCYMGEKRAERVAAGWVNPKQYGIVPCLNIACGYPTRPTRVPHAKAPGTRPRAGQGLCNRCYKNRDDTTRPVTGTSVSQEIIRAREDATMRGFERFVAARRARQIPVEGKWSP